MPGWTKELIESDFQKDLDRRSAELGADFEAVFDHDLRQLETFAFSNDCLDPYEVELYCLGELDDNRFRHTESCPSCLSMLSLAQPTDVILERIIARSRPAIQALAGRRRVGEWTPVTQAAAIEGCILIAVALILASLTQRDFVFSVTLSEELPKIFMFASGLVVVTLLPLATVFRPRVGNTAALSVRYGGVFVGSASALFLAIFFLLNSNHVSAENSRLRTSLSRSLSDGLKAVAHRTPTVGASFIANKDFDGRFRAQNDSAETISFLFDPANGRRTRNLGTIYEGVVGESKDGPVIETSNHEQKSVSESLLAEDGLRQGDRVFAFVPANTSVVTMVHYARR
ncbi:MAG: hypothetical protein U1E61_08880 [Bradyrhizobium sp.]